MNEYCEAQKQLDELFEQASDKEKFLQDLLEDVYGTEQQVTSSPNSI
jgi:hypothetical protein